LIHIWDQLSVDLKFVFIIILINAKTFIYFLRIVFLFMGFFIYFKLYIWLLRENCLIKIISFCKHICCEIKLLRLLWGFRLLKDGNRMLCPFIKSSLNWVKIWTNKHRLQSRLKSVFGRYYFVLKSSYDCSFLGLGNDSLQFYESTLIFLLLFSFLFSFSRFNLVKVLKSTHTQRHLLFIFHH